MSKKPRSKKPRSKQPISRDMLREALMGFAATGFLARDSIIADHAIELIDRERNEAHSWYSVFRRLNVLEKELRALQKRRP